ncbi:hypothetical protein FACS189429_3630 [Bacteroidia bacterium]|nr:hypothetical protein FACS189429_3630 [Bacteroidia bacterium]
MNIDEIKKYILNLSDAIIEIAKEYTTNSYPVTHKFIIDRITDDSAVFDTFFKEYKYKRKLLKKGEKVDIDRLTYTVFEEQHKLSWIDLCLAYTNKKGVVFIVALVELNKVKDDMRFHAYYPTPPPVWPENKKFDLNGWLEYRTDAFRFRKFYEKLEKRNTFNLKIRKYKQLIMNILKTKNK